MSREQSDQVALANDGADKPRSGINQPFPANAYKRWIASGAIVPPWDEGPSGRWITTLIGTCIVGGICAIWIGVAWK